MEISQTIKKKRGLSTEDARWIRQRGHNDALEFALAIGLSHDYENDAHAKKDVIDLSGDSHSVKSGDKKWQIFLYRLGRFESDDAFKVMNGMGALLIECIKSFPESFDEYQKNKSVAKDKLRTPMKALAEKLQDKTRLKGFLNKAMFNGGEVNYLTIKQDGIFHVYLNKDIIELLGKNLEICNSRAITQHQNPEQKVLLRYKGSNLGEIEMRNDTKVHYREIRFNMLKKKFMDLISKIPLTNKFNKKVFVYGNASKRFGRWERKKRV